jgi:tyrosyl-tRNA synthetase
VDPVTLSDAVFETLAAEVPSTRVSTNGSDVEIVDVLAAVFELSKTAARKLVQQGAVSVNGAKLAADAATVPLSDAVRGRWMLVSKGAREIAVVQLAD